MEYLSSTNTNENSFKNLWKRPGGTFAKVTGWAAIIAMVFAFCKYALPFMVAAAANLLVLIAELVALFVVLYILTSKEFRRAVSLTWLQIMRKLYGLIVNIDPIAILQNGINEMRKQMDTVHENVTRLQTVLESMKTKLNEYKSKFENNIAKRDVIMKKIKSLTDENEVLKYKAKLQLLNNDITRGEAQIRAQRERIVTSEKYLEIMKKLEIATDYKVRDAQSELSYRKDEYEQAKAQQKAMSSITSILKGSLTRSMEEELAMEQISNTINTSIAEINRLLDGSNDILVNFELNSEVSSAKADEIVKMFDSNGFDIFNSTDDTPKITFAGMIANKENEKKLVMVENTPTENGGVRYFDN